MKTVGVVSSFGSIELMQILDRLGNVFNVHFEQRSLSEDEGVDAWYFSEVDHATANHIKFIERPCYATVKMNELVKCGDSTAVVFYKHPVLPVVLNSGQIIEDDVTTFNALPRWFENSDVLASKDGLPIWVVRGNKGCFHQFVAFTPPELKDDEPLFQHFNGRRFLRLLPLVNYLQGLSDEHEWEQSPLMSCFMFDDPNLHWKTYGFIDFAEMARDAQKYNYHVSFATVPIDAWYVHKPTAAIFRRYNNQLSLLMHGNSHVPRELSITDYVGSGRVTLSHAQERVARLEQCSGVEVSRVMAPPHGVYSNKILAEMSQLGFEAACIPRGALRHLANETKSPNMFGMLPCDIIEGLPLFPRFPLNSNYYNNILVAAILHQPIIPTGHHEDVAEGLQMLRDIAQFINSLGVIKWTSLKNISRSHYARRFDGRIFHIKMFTKRIEIHIPEGINCILVERPWLREEKSELLAWRTSGDIEWKQSCDENLIPVIPGQNIEIVSAESKMPYIEDMNIPDFQIWSFIRRLLTEVRDRTTPLRRRVSIGLSKRL